VFGSRIIGEPTSCIVGFEDRAFDPIVSVTKKNGCPLSEEHLKLVKALEYPVYSGRAELDMQVLIVEEHLEPRLQRRMHLAEGIQIDTVRVMQHAVNVCPPLDVFRRKLDDRVSHRRQDLAYRVGYGAGWFSILQRNVLP